MMNLRFSSMRREYDLRPWTIQGDLNGDGWRQVPGTETRAALDALRTAFGWDVRRLAGIHGQLLPHSLLGMRRGDPNVFWDRAWPELLRAAETGLVRIHERTIAAPQPVRYVPLESAGPVLGPAPESVKPTEDFWIAIELVDDDGAPVANERYQVRTPEGRVIEGTLDEQGRARVGQLAISGNCEVTFPDLDARDWKAA